MNEKLKKIELEVTVEELRLFGDYCFRHEIKFNDWVRILAHEAIEKEKKEKENDA